MIPYKEKSFLHLQKRNSSLHSRENLLVALGDLKFQIAGRKAKLARV